jgi:hypothetical protein
MLRGNRICKEKNDIIIGEAGAIRSRKEEVKHGIRVRSQRKTFKKRRKWE